MSSIPQNLVVISHNQHVNYPSPPFNPKKNYPEYKFNKELSKDNEVYGMVRETLHNLGLDKKNFNKKNWNPLGVFVKKGENIVIKPNFVTHNHPRKLNIFSIITHGSVIRALIDYSYIAVGKKGKISICDSPLQTGNFDEIVKSTGLDTIQKYYKEKGIKIDIIDLRTEYIKCNNKGAFLKKIKLKGDPKGYTSVDLGKNSELIPIKDDYRKFAVGYYEKEETIKHHNKNFDQYYIPKTILSADLFINLPKLKTHKKAGITVSLKNLIGINGQKSWVPHYRTGSPKEGGDEYPKKTLVNKLKNNLTRNLRSKPLLWNLFVKLWDLLNKITKEEKLKYYKISHGSWYGNNTLWRTILDINKILFYSDKKGVLGKKKRNYLSLVDGIISGERNGPLDPNPKQTGILLAGTDPVAVDSVCANLMGFNINKLKTLSQPKNIKKLKLGISDINKIDIFPRKFRNLNLKFNPPDGWNGHIER